MKLLITSLLLCVALAFATSPSISKGETKTVPAKLFKLGRIYARNQAVGHTFEKLLLGPGEKIDKQWIVRLELFRNVESNLLLNLRNGDVDYLDLHENKLTPNLLKHFASLNLVGLDLSETNVKDADLAMLTLLKHLQVLDLNHCSITDDAMKFIPRFKRLRDLNLGDTNVSDVAMAYLAQLPELKYLELKRCDVGSNPYWISQLKGIESLNLTSTLVDDKAIPILARLRNLVMLHLPNCKITDRAFQTAPPMNQLHVLSLQGTRVGDETCSYLSRCPNLEALALSRTGVSDKGLLKLAASSKLSDLNLSELDGITVAGLRKFFAARPDLFMLDLSGTKLKVSHVIEVLKSTKLNSLKLNRIALSNDDATSLGKLSQLQFLSIMECNLHDDRLKSFVPKLKSLTVLDLDGNPLMNPEPAVFKPLTRLKMVSMRDALIDKPSRDRFKKSMPAKVVIAF